MSGNSIDSSDPNHSLDPTKNYTKVQFQQGKPILDVDLNDLSSTLENQSRNNLIQKMGYGPAQLDYREWALTAVDSQAATSVRNKDNFSFTLGRLDTHIGVVDTESYKVDGDGLDSRIIFDTAKVIEEAGVSLNTDREFNNYILKGSVTSSNVSSGALFISDANKNFSGLKLTGFDETILIDSDYASYASQINNSITNLTQPTGVRLKEQKCRLRFLTGNNLGEEQEIIQVATSELKLLEFTNPVSVGDEFIILPPNTLTYYRSLYDGASSKALSQPNGFANLPKLMTYVQVFENDVNSTEDSAIQSSVLGFETTHRTQLRWCVRVALVFSSVTNDTHNAQTLTDLKLQHIFKQLSESGHVEYQTLVDSVDSTASQDDGYLQATFTRDVDSSGNFTTSSLQHQVSPYFEGQGITPMHFFSAQEATKQNLMWAFFKSLMVSNIYNDSSKKQDIQLLNLFHSESKSISANASQETLSEYFYPGMYTDFTSLPLTHAWLSNVNNYERSAGSTALNVSPPSYLTPPKVMLTHADISTDLYQSRTLFGNNQEVLLDGTAPLVFSSVKAHLSYVDQILLGKTGLGRSIGGSSTNSFVDSYMNYTLSGTTTEVTQAGYGSGAVKMVDILSEGSPSYFLRERGSLSTHEVTKNTNEHGWSFYNKEGSGLDDNGVTDTSIRQWNEGLGQTLAIRDSINFRKLAIKTTAHKSMDLFTITARPIGINHSDTYSDSLLNTFSNDIDTNGAMYNSTANQAIMLPFKHGNTALDTQNAFNDSYGGLGFHKLLNTYIDKFSTNLFIPSYNSTIGKEKFDIKTLLEDYQPNNKGVSTFSVPSTVSSADNQFLLGNYFGPWNRFSFSNQSFNRVRSNDDKLRVPMDLWSNRCTAMRLRYHVGDFYPNGVDSRGIPKNLLVDSLNLFIRIEPLSLAHWATMPKHQHSIIENSLVLADGIEALLKVSHGLGDIQKLLNNNGQPLIQSNSPYKTEEVFESDLVDTFSTRTGVNVGDVDPKDLPFGYENQPFVHWYHPAQENIRSAFDLPTNQRKYTVYPKFGRRSLIIPAITPNDFYDPVLSTNLVEHLNYVDLDDGASASYVGAINMSTASAATSMTDDSPVTDKALISYAVHGTNPLVGADNPNAVTSFQIPNRIGGNVTGHSNSIVFPYVPDEYPTTDYHLKRPGPVFLPANRFYLRQESAQVNTQSGGGTSNLPNMGFHPVIEQYNQSILWGLNEKEDSQVPYSERDVYWLEESGYANAVDLPNNLEDQFNVWSVPVMRAAIRTTTVAGIIGLVRTSFNTTALSVDQNDSLLNDYNFTMPSTTFTVASTNGKEQVPTIGPDLATDTLFVGDTGTGLSQVYKRTGFISPLTLGIGAINANGQLIHNNNTETGVLRDSFDVYQTYTSNTDPLLKCFTSLNNMGLQLKLLINSSLRILHTRPSGGELVNNLRMAPSAPKSLTEVFIAHDRSDSMQPIELPTPDSPLRKPFIHLASMNKSVADASQHPNYPKLSHLYSMVSDSIGSPHAILSNSDSQNLITVPTDDILISSTSVEGVVDLSKEMSQRTALGDTFTVDPFDYALHSSMNGSSLNPLKEFENQQQNSGIEIDLIKELDMIHANPSNYNLDAVSDYNGTSISLIDMLPTSAELSLPGDHEIAFVLYTGHYGANMYTAPTTTQDLTHVPPVAGCHITATIELNRPSDRVSSSITDEHHYGNTVESNPIKTYSILSTK